MHLDILGTKEKRSESTDLLYEKEDSPYVPEGVIPEAVYLAFPEGVQSRPSAPGRVRP